MKLKVTFGWLNSVEFLLRVGDVGARERRVVLEHEPAGFGDRSSSCRVCRRSASSETTTVPCGTDDELGVRGQLLSRSELMKRSFLCRLGPGDQLVRVWLVEEVVGRLGAVQLSQSRLGSCSEANLTAS